MSAMLLINLCIKCIEVSGIQIILGASGFLLSGHIFMQIGDCVTLALKLTGIEWNTACRLRPDCKGMINIVFIKAR